MERQKNMTYSHESNRKSYPVYIDVRVDRHYYRVNKSCNSCLHNTGVCECLAAKSEQTETLLGCSIGCSNWDWNERNGV
jgi:hypothetical protein